MRRQGTQQDDRRAMIEIAAKMEVAVLIGENNEKGLFISCSRQLVAGG